MFDRDHWQEIINALASNPLRTFLTAFGVFWGIFMLTVMLGAGNGLRNGVNRGFADTATNSFFVWSRSTNLPFRGLPAGRRFELGLADHAAIRQRVPEARVVCPRNQLGGFRGGNNVTRGNKAGAFSIMADYPSIREIQSIDVTHGRFINPFDIEQKRKVAVVGTRVVEILFGKDEEPIGDYIRVNGVYFRVVGVFRPTEPGEEGLEEAQTVFLPFSTFQRAFNRGDDIGWFAIRSRDDVPASVAEEKVLALLRERHRIHPDDERALGHFNIEEEFNEVQGLFFGIQLLIWIVGIGTLTAGVIGVSNIMLVIVRERTNEIGVRRAIGATPLAIMTQIVVEAIVLTSVAGYLGLVAGMAIVVGVQRLVAGMETEMFHNPEVPLESAAVALGVLIVAGTLAGMIPARRAVKVSPVDALRSI